MGQAFYGYRAATVALAASTVETLTFSGDTLPKSGVVGLSFAITGTSKQYNSIDFVVVKVNGVTQYHATQAQLRLYLERFSRANESPADADTNWMIPFYIPDEKGDRRYEAQLRPGDVTVEVTTTSVANTGTLQIGWVLSDVKAKFYTQILRHVLNIAASDSAGERILKREGLLRGFSVNTTGLDEIRLIAGGQQMLQLPGTHLIASQRPERNDTTLNPLSFKLHAPVPAGELNFLLRTAGTWAGVANELVTYTIVPAGGA